MIGPAHGRFPPVRGASGSPSNEQSTGNAALQAEKDVPQPQVAVALGLVNLNPPP